MGREGYWGGVGAKKGGGGRKLGREDKDISSSPSGCMCAVFQLFDFHQFQFQFPSNHHQHSSPLKPESFPDEDPIPKGTEAPRNSLQLEEPNLLPSITKEEDKNLNIPMGIQVKTNGESNRTKSHGVITAASDCSSEISSSPGTKTPTLVARLMGLDLLPDQSSSSIPSSPSTLSGTPNPPAKSTQFRPPHSLQTRPVNHPRYCFDNNNDFTSGTRSLPETPRISSARRSDVEYHHRLSLQINKENMGVSEDQLVLSRISSLRIKEMKNNEYHHHLENRSPRHYARKIVKQVKESIGSRKVGSDITNTVRNREHLGSSRDEILGKFKAKKISNSKASASVNSNNVEYDSSPGKHSATTTKSSCSMKPKFLEPKNKPIGDVLSTKDHNVTKPPNPSLSSVSPSSSSSQVNFQGHNNNHQVSKKPKVDPAAVQQQRPIKKLKKMAEERLPPPPRILKKPPQTSDDIVRNKQEEPFVCPTTATRAIINLDNNKKCKKTPLSNNLLSISSVPPTLLPVKKHPTPPATKIPPKQESKRSCSQLSSCLSQSYPKQQDGTTTHKRDARDSSTNNSVDIHNAAAAITATARGRCAAGAEYEYYITRILRRTGIDKDSPVSFANWFSPSHPLDPSIFYYLELQNFAPLFNYSPMSHQCNRKLLFHLVDELLVEIIRPHINMKPWATPSIRVQNLGHMKGSHLVSILCSKIGSYPGADCRVLEDIDALVNMDFPPLKFQNDVAFGEEGEGIVTEIEKEVLDTVIHETALIFFGEA